LGDTLQVATPTGTDIGIVELISLGYTTLRAPDAAARDALRSKLMASLAQRFGAARLDSAGADLPAFS
jgi:hypothetical protein